MAIEIHLVSSADDVRDFAGLSKTFYPSDPGYVAPLEALNERRLLGFEPWRPDAKLKLFIARRDGRAVGTISVMRDRAHDKFKDENVAFFSFFECVEDEEVCDALLAAATEQALAWEADVLRGPRGLTRVDEIGVFIEGHGRPPLLASHHPPYYRTFLEARGFEKQSDRFAYEIDLDGPDGQPVPLPQKLREKAAAVDIPGLEIRAFQWRTLHTDLDLAYEVFVEAFRAVPDNTPWPRSQFRSVAIAFLALSNRHMLQLAVVDGRAAGFALCFPEFNEAVVQAKGRLLPLGWARFLRGLGRARTASWKLFGVMPEFRGSGLHALLIKHAIEGIRIAGYRRLEASLIDERNGPMRHIVESAGCVPYRRYRIYEKRIA